MKATVKTLLLLIIFSISSSTLNAQLKLWGTQPYGGNTEAGTIFEFNLNENEYDVVYEFHKYNGDLPRYCIILADNNKFYGIADGGFGNFGSIIYEYDPETNGFKIVHDFFDPVNYTSCSANDGYLLQASDGKLYGYTQNCGEHYDGQLFVYDIDSDEFQVKVEFESATKGETPVGGLFEATDGRLYGVTYEGGSFGFGVLFVYDPVINMYAVLKHFNSTTLGANPRYGVIQASNGLLYGMTPLGGAMDNGILYQYDIGSNNLTVLHEFNNAIDGGKPYGGLMQASDGNLYGMMGEGGLFGYGGIFQYSISQSMFIKETDFNETNGSYPSGSLIEFEGFLYGMTPDGGISSNGVLFRYDYVNNQIYKLLDFYGEDYGEYPTGSLTIGPEGTLFGQTHLGGSYVNSGIMFEYNPTTNIFTKRFDFRSAENGSSPFGSLILADDGYVYGTGYIDGELKSGTIFRIDPSTRQFESIYNFDWLNTGGGVKGGVIQASNGMLYGMAGGGTYYDGVLYTFNPSSFNLTVLHHFEEVSSGYNPEGKVLEADNEKLYGVTPLGGVNSHGVLFEYDMNSSTFSKLLDFQQTASGKEPHGTPVQAANGKIYGVAEKGGQFDFGVLYEYDPIAATYTRKVDFDGTNKGRYPTGSLLEYSDNVLYGITQAGGINDCGIIYMYDVEDDILTKLFDFELSSGGAYTQASLMHATNNKIYGSVQMGGDYNNGGIFEFDPVTLNYSLIYSFETYGDRMQIGPFIEVESNFGIDDVANNSVHLNLYPNPAQDRLTISCNNINDAQISILDAYGKLIKYEQHNGNNLQSLEYVMDISDMEKGIYFIHLSGNGYSYTSKFVKLY